MKLQDESIGSIQQFDCGPVLEVSSKTGALFIPQVPITMTADSAGVATIGPIDPTSPIPPTDQTLLDEWNKGVAAGATVAQLTASMFTVKAVKAGSTLITIGGGDPGVPNDTLTLTVVAPADAPGALTGDQLVGNLRNQ